MKIHYSLTLSLLLLAGTTLGSKATVVVNDDFDAGYTTGALAGQTGTDDAGFSGNFTSPTNSGTSATVVSGGLTYSSGSVYVSGGTQSVDATTTINGGSDALSRSFSSDLTGQTYFERIVIDPIVKSTTAGLYLELSLNDTVNSATGSFEGYKGGAVGAEGPDSNFVSSGLALTSGANLLVAEFVWNPATSSYSTVNFFLDPTSTTLGTPSATTTTSGTDLGGGLRLFFSQTGASAVSPITYGIDSFAIGTTYADVVTAVPEPSTIAFLLTGGLALMVIARRNRAIA